MSDADVTQIAAQTMMVAAKVAAPVLITALLVGFLISLFQAATQIQEQTLSFVPKIIAVAIALLVTGNWVLAELVSFTHSLFDLYLMIGFGVAGYLLRKLEVPLVPIILGLLLGTLMEENLRRALNISNGDWTILVGSPLAIGLWAFAIIGLLAPVIFGRFLRPRRVDETAAVQD